MEVRDLVERHGITFEIARERIAPAAFGIARVLEAVARSNAASRLRGIDEDLDAEQLDPVRVEAFLRGLACLPQDQLALAAGRTVRLNLQPLRLHRFDAAVLEDGFRLEHDPDSVNPQLAAVRVAAPLAAAAARARLARAARIVDAPAEAAETPDRAAARRSAAIVRHALAADLLAAAPGDAEARAALRAARAALGRLTVAPSTGGMP